MTAHEVLGLIRTEKELEDLVRTLGILPFFRNSIPGFSVEEHVPRELWFTEEPGPWEWKGEVIRGIGCGYGKLFEQKAAFVDRAWFPDLANYRRDGYDFDARYDDGLASRKDKQLYDLIAASEPVVTTDLKRMGNYRKGGSTGFDGSVVRLQMQGYVLIRDFVYRRTPEGKTYGWGISEYGTPERWFGPEFSRDVYSCSPEESGEKLYRHLAELFPEAPEEALRRFLG